MHFILGPREILLIAGVSIQATVLAYIYNPSLKALLYGLPIPFTLSTLAIRKPVDATNALGLILLFLFTQGVRVLHIRFRLNIVLSIVLCALGYCAAGWVLAGILPKSDLAFWISSISVLLLGLWIHLTMPMRGEPGHRSPMAVVLKLPLIVAVVICLVIVKNSLQGFMTVFPMVGVIGAYESRHSLWTLGRQIPVLMLTLIPLMITSHLTYARVGLGLSLFLGWIVFLGILIPLTRSTWYDKTAAL